MTNLSLITWRFDPALFASHPETSDLPQVGSFVGETRLFYFPSTRSDDSQSIIQVVWNGECWLMWDSATQFLEQLNSTKGE